MGRASSKLYADVQMRRELVPLNPMLFKSQLYTYIKS